ncbi:diguanylate cyclase domain-containing protein [Vibrio sp. WJH972]
MLTKSQHEIRHLTSLLINIGSFENTYDQIKLLDAQGQEVLSVRQNPDHTFSTVPNHQLQDQSERYFFKIASSLNPGEIYISKYDVSIETGKLEASVKPMIRFAMAIHNEHGQFLGVGIINYLGLRLNDIIQSLNIHDGDIAYLLNGAGYYLNNENKDKNWTFIFPEKTQTSFASEYPEVWAEVIRNGTGNIIHNNDEYYFTTFNLTDFPSNHVINHEKLFIIMHVPKASIFKEDQILNTGLFIGISLIYPLILFLIYKLAISRNEQDKLIEKLNFQAYNDSLTGLYNRQAIFDFLSKNLLISRRKSTPISIGFVDVNDLKKINDIEGHEAGDELIRGVSKAINTSIRQSDFAARIGGDEFLIIFIDCNRDNAEATMLRIQKNYQQLGKDIGKSWSLCYGCSQMREGDDTPEAMIERADKKMYAQKEQRKHAQDNVNLQVDKKDLIHIRTHSMDLDSVTQSVQSLDQNGHVIDISPEWLILTGYTREEAIGKHFTYFLDQESQNCVKENFPRIKGYGYVNNVALMMRRKDGTIIPTTLNGTSKYDDNGEFTQTFCEITTR